MLTVYLFFSELQTKHMFAKVPLKDDPNFASVNIRELVMLTTVLPQMQAYLDSECEGFFKLPMPDVYHCFYDGKGTHKMNITESSSRCSCFTHIQNPRVSLF